MSAEAGFQASQPVSRHAPALQRSPIIHRPRWLVGLLLAGLALAGCAGVPQAAEERYRIRPPGSSWVRISNEADQLAFRSPGGAATLALFRECQHPERGELRWVARHLFFGLRDQEIQSTEPAEVAGRPGVRTRIRARLDGMPVEVEAVTVRHAGCLYDFVHVARPDAFAASRPAFEEFVGSFAPLSP